MPSIVHSYFMFTVSNERYIVSWYENEVQSWQLHHCDQHENRFQMMS